MFYNFFITFVISYFIGCIPFALIISHFFASKNPGNEGSGNYGALNSYEITGKKYIGFLVFLFDGLKGVLAILIAGLIFLNPINLVVASISVVLGHTFNIFLKFRGGRGLATSLGVVFAYNPFLAIVWITLWFLFYCVVKKDVIFANTRATILTPFIVYFAPGHIIFYLNYSYYVGVYEYRLLAFLLCLIIFLAHFRKQQP